MDFKTVLIEWEDATNQTLHGSSAIMLNKKYVITTSKIFSAIPKHLFEEIKILETRKLYSMKNKLKSANLRVYFKQENSDQHKVKSANVLAFYKIEAIKSTKNILKYITIDPSNSVLDISTFFVLTIHSSGNIEDFRHHLKLWWSLIKHESIYPTKEIYITSTPFGRRPFIDSYTKGIISKFIGENECMMLTDTTSFPGSEGSPVYSFQSNVPFGIVVASACWWKGYYTTFTLLLDIRFILSDVLMYPEYKNDLTLIPRYPLIATLQSSLVQVCCGPQWGTGIILDRDTGIVLTNCHVVEADFSIRIYWKDAYFDCELIYKTPQDEVFDLAVLKCNNIEECEDFQSVPICSNAKAIGDEVYAVGFSLFPKGDPTITKGSLMQIDESMLKTSCCVNPGMSGGAVLNKFGELIGVIVCNMQESHKTYPRLNLVIPFSSIEDTLMAYLKLQDVSYLHQLHCKDAELIFNWKMFEAKL